MAAPSGTAISASDISKIENGGEYYLTSTGSTQSTINISKDTTLDLNGHGVYYKGAGNNPTFIFVKNGAKLTIKNSKEGSPTRTLADSALSKFGNAAVLAFGNGGDTPTSLKYYVTEPETNADTLGTTDTLYQYEYENPTGFIVGGSSGGSCSAVVNVASGSSFDLQSGFLCICNNYDKGTINPQVVFNEGTFTMEGGYLAGGNTSQQGGGVRNMSNSIMSMSGGVIAANKANSGAGVYAADGAKITLSGGVISGNTVKEATYGWSEAAGPGYGGGIYAVGATVTISGGYITNNSVLAHYDQRGQGLIGGGGLAIVNNSSQAKLSISGGYVTGNFSQEDGGGLYVGREKKGLGANFTLSGGIVASNVAQDGEGGGIRISRDTQATFNAAEGTHVYITNNKCNSDFDWGGGGVFVQEGGRLICLNALITKNDAGGYGGGVGACPTGQTVVTHTQGAAIYGNTDAGNSTSAHMSGGGHGKNMDSNVAYKSDTFRTNGHADYFLVRGSDSKNYITAVTGRMLGEGAANWDGSIDGKKASIDANSGAQAKYMVGLTSNPDEDAKASAIKVATLTISGNYAWNHGGGIMTNGGVVLGKVTSIDIYPGLSLDATKALSQEGMNASSQLKGGDYSFVLLRSDSDSEKPSWQGDSLSYGGCTLVDNVNNDADGAITLRAGDDYSSGKYRFYVVELPSTTTTFDKTIYQIDAAVEYEPAKDTKVLGITFKYYTVNSIKVTVISPDGTQSNYNPKIDKSSGNVSFTLTKDGNKAAAFTNELAPYKTSGSFTPQVKKHVEGGNMKDFTFELFDEDGFANGKFTGAPIQTKTTTKSEDRNATVTFDKIDYQLGLSDLDTKTRGGTKTYTYYVREKSGSDSGYTYDGGYYKIVVTAKDNPADDKLSGKLTTTAKYTYVDANGKSTDVAEGSDPTFNNKYGITLPSAGQAGITIAYIAGAAVLGYGVWRLVKARGKSRRGGE
ncbi:Spy0128 family protein [Parafannyhessea umbonata]|uniref:Uncharacterized protein n=1 Tax=Parafannyhessea umbonata TaxID=604330 RepID=A0A6N7WRZ1_9ACTN|nr:FctA domain-containing protein [Parafannyhessea umbonata]MST59470.1 hypothetical protein [Parafannyhessea umbonata]